MSHCGHLVGLHKLLAGHSETGQCVCVCVPDCMLCIYPLQPTNQPTRVVSTTNWIYFFFRGGFTVDTSPPNVNLLLLDTFMLVMDFVRITILIQYLHT